jgi:hypothetical protein
MARHDDLLAFIDDMATEFPSFSVVAVNQKESNATAVRITEVVADESDNEICLVRATTAQTDAGMNLGVFRDNLRTTIQTHSDYSLMVSEWFEIDDGYTARADLPLKTVELNENAKQFLLLY